MNLDAGTAGTSGSVPNAFREIRLADAATQGGFFTFLMPADCAAGSALTCAIHYIAGTTAAGQIRWAINAKVITPPAAADAAGTTTTFTGAEVSRTAIVLYKETVQTVLASVSALDIVRMSIQRVGADAADTYDTGIVRLAGALLGYGAAA